MAKPENKNYIILGCLGLSLLLIVVVLSAIWLGFKITLLVCLSYMGLALTEIANKKL